MKYVKTFESFNYNTTNEGWLWGEGNIFSKISKWYSGWKNKKAVEMAEATKKVVEDAANSGKFAKAQELINALPEGDLEELKQKMETFNPDTAAAQAPEGTEEELKELIQDSVSISRTKYGTPLYESRLIAINENAQTLGQKILKALGLAGKFLAIIVALVIVLVALGALIKIAAGAIAVAAAAGTGFSIFVACWSTAVATAATLLCGRVGYGAVTGK
jgi:hypothetical protein